MQGHMNEGTEEKDTGFPLTTGGNDRGGAAGRLTTIAVIPAHVGSHPGHGPLAIFSPHPGPLPQGRGRRGHRGKGPRLAPRSRPLLTLPRRWEFREAWGLSGRSEQLGFSGVRNCADGNSDAWSDGERQGGRRRVRGSEWLVEGRKFGRWCFRE